jgi:magnesium chelatase family protein
LRVPRRRRRRWSRGRIAGARARQWERTGATPNGGLAGRALRRVCGLDAGTAGRAALLADREGLSGRGTDRLLRVARTIADLAAEPVVLERHLDEAARFRAPVDRAALDRAS